MKQIASVTILSLLALRIFAQAPPPDGVRLDTKYDRFKDLTTVQCELVKWGEAPAKITVQANVSFSGKEPNETTRFWFNLSSNRSGASRETKPLFREATRLYLSTALEHLELPISDYHHSFFEIIPSFAESARAEFARDDCQKLIEAKSLKGKWGDVEFKFSDVALATLKEFISRFTPEVR
jgi:hypothetical protein